MRIIYYIIIKVLNIKKIQTVNIIKDFVIM